MKAPAAETYCAARVALGDGAYSRLRSGVGKDAPPIDPGHFAEPGPKAVMEAAAGLREEGDPITSEAIRHRMKQDGSWDEIGGAEWWANFFGHGGDGSDLARNAKMVSAAARLRRIDGHARDISDGATTGRKPREALREVREQTGDLLEVMTEEDSSVMDGRGVAEGVMEMLTSDEPQDVFLKTGFPALDDLLDGLVVGRVNVVAARTGHGKSAFCDQLMLNCARRWDEKKVIKFDLENSETAVKSRLSANLAGVDAQAIKRHAQHKSKLDRQQFSAVTDAAEQMQDLPIVIDTRSDADSSYIRSRCLAEQSASEVGLVIVDYVTQMAERGDGAMEKAMNAMSGLHALAKSLDVPVVAVSQVNRKPAAGDKEPQLHHLSWSDDVAQVPAQVHMLHHPHTHWEQTDRNPGGEPDEEDLFVFTRKNKGPAGATQLQFDTDTLRIYDENDRAPF
jgi:replicative DNA helicase